MKCKKIAAGILSAIIVLSMVSCGKKSAQNSSSKSESSSTVTTSQPDEIDPQLKSDLDYCVKMYSEILDLLKESEDPANEDDPDFQKRYKNIQDNADQLDATREKLSNIDKTTLNSAELKYYNSAADKVEKLAAQISEYNDSSTTSTTKQTTAAKKTTTKQATTTTKKASNDVSPEFKATMDSYEEFVDEYIEFMNNYKNSTDVLSMLNDYTEYMNKYSEVMEGLNSIDQSKLSAADAAYYLEVSSRITQKLSKVSL